MPDRVDLVGEEELMPGRKWLVYRNQRTGQLSKVPKEIMENPTSGKLMMNHLGGYDTSREGVVAQSMDPQQEMQVQSTLHNMQKQPAGHDYVQSGVPGREGMVPKSPLEVMQSLRQQLSGSRPEVRQTQPAYSSDPQTRLYELADEESALMQDPGSHMSERQKISEHKLRLHRLLNSGLMDK